jgi:hypothetical protein
MDSRWVSKGAKVLVRRVDIKTSGFSLAGVQLKFPMEVKEFQATILHVYGDKPENPTKTWFQVRRDDGVEEEVSSENVVAIL